MPLAQKPGHEYPSDQEISGERFSRERNIPRERVRFRKKLLQTEKGSIANQCQRGIVREASKESTCTP